jgi:APA family basic amino acid/polyamine antiporter
MYAFGAMLSFTIAHAAVVALRIKGRDEELVYRARPNIRLRGIDWPLFALLGGFGTAAAWIVIVVQEQATRLVGLGWLAVGFVIYALYRRRLHMPLRQTVRAPAIVLGLEVEYRTILVPVLRTAESEEALIAAARLASERRARIVILHVLEVPLDKALDAELPKRSGVADQILDEAQTLLETYAGVQITSRLERARSAGPAIVAEAARREAEVVILGAPRTKVKGGKPIFGHTVDYVLRNAPTRVAVVAGKQAA